MKGVYTKYASIRFGLEIAVNRYAPPAEGKQFNGYISEEHGDVAEGHALAASELLKYLIGLWHVISLIDFERTSTDGTNDSGLALAVRNVGELGSLLSEAALMRVDALHEAHEEAIRNLSLPAEGGER